MIRVVLVGLLLAGCVTTPRHLVGEAPSVKVILGRAADVEQFCTYHLKRPSSGCVFPDLKPAILVCPFNDADCLAHEVEHLLGGRHDPANRWQGERRP